MCFFFIFQNLAERCCAVEINRLSASSERLDTILPAFCFSLSVVQSQEKKRQKDRQRDKEIDRDTASEAETRIVRNKADI